MRERVSGLTHANTLAVGAMHASVFELMRGDRSRARTNALELVRIVREYDLRLFRALGEFLGGWATADGGALTDGLEAMRRGAESLREQNAVVLDGLIKIALSEVEARAGDLERAIAVLDEALAMVERTGYRAFEAELHRARGEMLLRRDPADFVTAEQALQTAVAIARRQGTRAFELRAALSLTKLCKSIARPAEAHATLAPALEGFAPTPEMPEIAEAQGLLEALAETEEVKAAEAQRQRRLHLQTTYGQAMMMAKGYAAEETKAAFSRAAELTGRTDSSLARVAALKSRFLTACTEGKLRSAREMALTFLREAEEAGRVAEAAGANSGLGLIAYWHGDFVEARTRCERALDARDARTDPNASLFLALTVWQLGQVERARELTDGASKRTAEIGHIPTIIEALFYKSYFELWRGDPPATLSAAKALEVVAREHATMQFLNEADLHSGWAHGRITDAAAGAAQVQRVLAAFVEQGVKVNLGFYTGLLAQLEAETLGAVSALTRIDEAFRLSEQVELRCSLPFLHRLRGEILLTRDPADPAPAEEAFRTSIAIAKEQGARSPVLLASLALAKLLQTTGRLAEAHTVLSPALEGFLPTPEMPQIAEAQALLGALADTEEVKAAEAQRQRRLHLQTSYGQAMMWTKGFSAEETKAAFSRATELTAKTDNFADRFAMAHGQWTFALARGELQSARQLASAFLKEAETAGRAVEAGVARRGLAFACYLAADFLEARIHCERALEDCDPKRDREAQERFHDATGPMVVSVLGVTMWQLGEIDRARELIDQANRHASDLDHPPSMAQPLRWKAHLEILRGDAPAALIAAEALEGLGRERGLPFWRALAELGAGWARGRLHDAATGAEEVSRALADRIEQGVLNDAWFSKGLLAELEAESLGVESALARVDEGVALSRQVETRCNLPFVHLLRGKLLLERNPSNPDPAEEAFRTGLEIAKQQGARSWGLRAALSLAKLYQSTARPAEAHAVLAPALEGFSATPEMPEIAEAQALMERLA
jgi:predicted ATPase